VNFCKVKYIFILLIFCGISVFSQEENQEEDLKIGLVLSGGGAKGLAHIGALKVIEESGVHIDYIGGTSMGAIIGSLYASGYSAGQLDSIFRKTNFRTLIQDDLPRRAKSPYKKEGSDRYAVTLPFDDFKLSFPSGLSKGQNIYNLLAQLMYPVKDVERFEDLPIPFFCIGADIETGERILLEEGSLVQSVAASSAIPSVFKPVLIGDKMVSDGGITDNYPIEELQKRGMDYIIGVDVQDSLVDREELKSVFEIMTQVSNFRTINAMKEKRGKTDLYIKPDISEFTILSFDKGDEIVKSGEEAALKFIEKLESLATAQKRKAVPRDIKIPDSISIGEISISGSEIHKRNFIRGKLRIPTNEKISYNRLNEGLNNLSATGDFERIQYELSSRGKDENDLKLKLLETNNRTNLRFGLHYDGLYKSAALVNFVHKRFIFNNDMLSLDLIPGENLRYKFNYFIDKGLHWSVGLRSSLNQFDRNVRFRAISGNAEENYSKSKLPLDYLDLTNQFYIETFFLNFNALSFRTGLEHKYTKVKSGEITEILDEDVEQPVTKERTHTFGPYAYLEYDSYNHGYFPTKGFYFRGDIQAYLFDTQSSFDFNSFSVIKGKAGMATSLFPKTSLRGELGMGFHLGNTEMKAQDFFLGGYGNDYVNNIIPFFGYSFLANSGNSYIKASAEIDYEIFNKNHVIFGYNIANVGDDLYKDGKIFELPDYSAFYLGYGMETLLGPLEVYYSFSPEITRSRWFVSLGYWF